MVQVNRVVIRWLINLEPGPPLAHQTFAENSFEGPPGTSEHVVGLGKRCPAAGWKVLPVWASRGSLRIAKGD